MLAYYEEETNRSEDLALPYLQRRAASTHGSPDTSEYAHQNGIFLKQISGWFKASFTQIIRVKNMRFQKCPWRKNFA